MEAGAPPGGALRRAAARAVKVVALVTDYAVGTAEGPRLLIYHDVGPPTGSEMVVSPSYLEQQIDWLTANCEIVALDAAIAQRGDRSPRPLVVMTFDDGHRGLYEHGYPLLEERGVPFTLYLHTAAIEGIDDPRPGSGALSWSDVNDMLSSGLMTLGAHTHHHVDLRQVSKADAEREVAESNRLIHERTGVEARHFAYPWGYWSAQADGVVRTAYASAALGSGKPVGHDSDPYLLHRVPIQASDGRVFFRAKVRRGMRFEDRMRRLVKGYRGP